MGRNQCGLDLGGHEGEQTVSNVIQLIQPIDESRLHAALREITGADTNAIVLVTASDDAIGVRSFGPDRQCMDALKAALTSMQEPE